MKYIPKFEEIEDYFNKEDYVSQSGLKRLLHGVAAFNAEKEEQELYYEEKGHFIIGNGVDTWMTRGKKAFDDNFTVLLADKPSDKVMSIIHRIIDKIELSPYTSLETLDRAIIDECAIEEGYQKNWKPDTRINAIVKTGSDYFTALVMANGKQICSDYEWNTIHTIMDLFLSNSHTSKLCADCKSDEGMDYLYQLPLYYTNDSGINLKALLDIVEINHNAKTIMIYDVKTMGDYIINLPSTIRKRRYDIQLAFYNAMIYYSKKHISDIIGKNIDGYTILNPALVVASTISTETPIIATITYDLLSMGTYGRDEIIINDITFPKIKGYVDLLDDYRYYTNNGFADEKLFVEHNFRVHCDWYKLI